MSGHPGTAGRGITMAARTRLRAALVLAATVLTAACRAQPPELGVDGPVTAPIEYGKWFQYERDLFGYNPAFMPGPVSFDLANRPYMLAFDDDAGTNAAVQTLDDDGNWIRLDHKVSVLQRYPEWDGAYLTGVSCEARIVFDGDGDAYMVMDARSSNLEKVLLLHSRDRCRSWDVYELPCGYARLEFQDTHNDLSRPPVVLGRAVSYTHLTLPTN